MSRILRAVRFKPWAILPVIAVALLSVGSASAGATAEIEGIWSFNGGQIGIQRQANGEFVGTVVVATAFAECSHPVGQEIWTGITEQADGSYWGMHQWYLDAPTCAKNPVLGPTAWRVLREPDGARYLRVCFSHPGSSQPTIAPNGDPKEPHEYAAYHVTYGCFDSGLTASLPGSSGSGQGDSGGGGSVEHLTLPGAPATQCVRAKLFKIRLKEPKYDPFKTVTITFNGHRVASAHKGNYIVATLNLGGLTKKTFKVKIRATTVLGHHLSANRTYHACAVHTKPHHHPKKKHKRG
jgi:hypothetical protein